MKGISFILLVVIMSCSSKERKVSGDPITEQMFTRYESYHQCYVESDLYQGRQAPPQGIITVNFDITQDGIMKNEKIIKNDFAKDPNFQACILHQIRGIEFPMVKTFTNHTQSINFYPGPGQ